MRGLLRTSFPTSNRIKEHILNFDQRFLSTHYQWTEQVRFLSCFKRAFACASPHCVNKCHRNTLKTMLIGVIETHREEDRSIVQISLPSCLRRLCRLPRLCSETSPCCQAAAPSGPQHCMTIHCRLILSRSYWFGSDKASYRKHGAGEQVHLIR